MEPENPKQMTGQLIETPPKTETNSGDGIITTEKEYEGYYIVKAILSETVNPSRVVMRDAKSYCAILFDDNNQKPICHFYFDSKQKYIGVFDNKTRSENKIPISELSELFKDTEHFKKIGAMYDTTAPKIKAETKTEVNSD